MTASLREVLRNTLDNLTEADFKRFKHYLRDQGQIAWGKLEKADPDDNVELIVQVYSMGAGDVMLSILKKMNHNQLAMDLERDLGRLGGQQSSLGLGGGVNVNTIAHSGGMVNAPAVTGCTIRGPVTFNFGRRHTPQQEGVTIRPQDKEKISLLKSKLQPILVKKFVLISKDLEEIMGKKDRLQDIYTELCIIEGTAGVNDVHEVAAMQLRQTETRTRSGNSVKLSNIFSDHYHTGIPAKKVLTLGIAGVGKTVAVQKFVLDWAEVRNNQNIELVFVLPFRELNAHKDDNYSLSDLLLKFYPELEELNKSTELKGATVLFVFDGLDESRLNLDFKKFISDPKEKSPVTKLITSLITGKMLPSALIWVTTRPAAAKKDLCKLFDLVTEVQGFNEDQREEYFRKVIPEKAEEIITHIKSMRSLYIMCHIPVFCQITAIVFGEMGKAQSACNHDIPKTLTEMYTQFCAFQINRMNDRYPEDKKMCAKDKGQLLVKLGKLAFKYLEKDTLIFHEEDLTECDIDVNLEALQAGLCTQIFKKEHSIGGESMFSFVHLSVQEFLAALYMLHTHATDKVNLLIETLKERFFWQFKYSRFHLYKMALDRALQSENGHLDLCVRFLLGLAPLLEPKIAYPLNLWLPELAVRDVSIKKTVQYIKEKIGEDKSPERIINLFHCLNELGDNSLVNEINRKMKSAGEEMNLTPAQCSALAYLLLMSAEKLDEFDLKKYLRSEEGLRRMLPVVKVSKRVWLNQCHLYKESCEMMASVLQGTPTNLRELDMSGNDLQDEGFDLLCEGLTHPRCKLEKLRCAACKLTERSYEIVASALQSANSPLRVLDLGHNGLQKSEEKLLAAFQSPNCKLEILRLAGSKLTERFLALTLQGATPNLRELDISDSKLQDCKGELLDQPLNQDYIVRPISCKLICCRLKHTSSVVVASVFQSFSSQLSDLDMSGSDLHTSEENLLSGLGNPNCQLKSLRLKDCKLTHESCEVVATFVQSATSLLELDLSKNDLRDSGVQLLSKGLSSPHCKLQTLRLSGCQITNQGCSLLASELKSCHSYLKELDLSYNHLGESGIRELTDIQNDPSCKLETFRYDHVATKDEMVKKKRSLKLKLQKHLEKRFSVVHQEAGDCKVQNIYAELHIVDGRTGGVSNEHEVTTINMGQIRTRPSSEDKQVKLANMFTDNSVTNVLTLGIAGVGKTIAVQKFVMDWVEEKANQDIDFVFVLSFRELNLKKGKHCNLLDVLESFYPYRKDLEYILDLSECKILFVLDGLDESRLNLDFGKCIFTLEAESSVDILITSLIKGTLVPSALLWVTTRPAAASLIPEECFDLVREVRGFNDDQKDEFFWKNIHNPEKAKRLIDHINKNRSLHYMCRIPAFCRVLANVVDKLLKDQSKEASSKTLTEFYTLYCVSQIKTMM